ncbi:MAG: cyclic nucleotide-binding domain-containing protein [Syntrophobacter sp.]
MYIDSGKPNPTQAIEISVYDRGERILREGQESPFFYVVLSGRASVSLSGTRIRLIGEQDIFGLENLFFRKPSYYTVFAIDECRIAKYGPDTLDHVIRNSPRMVQTLLSSTLNQLAQTTCFLVEKPEPSKGVRVGFYNDGESVMEEKTHTTEIYRLVSTQGGLRVTMHGKEIARIDRPGEFFGCVAGLFELPREASINSIGESVLEIYDFDDLDLLVRDYPDAAWRVMKAMMLRLSREGGQHSGPEPTPYSFSGE